MTNQVDPFLDDCWACASRSSEALKSQGDTVFATGFRMYLCPKCGDKRCAKAVDHRNECENLD